jgi:hypothetical protein
MKLVFHEHQHLHKTKSHKGFGIEKNWVTLTSQHPTPIRSEALSFTTIAIQLLFYNITHTSKFL